MRHSLEREREREGWAKSPSAHVIFGPVHPRTSAVCHLFYNSNQRAGEMTSIAGACAGGAPRAAHAAQEATSSSLGTNDASATAHLLRKAASVLWRTLAYLARDGMLILNRMNDMAIAEMRDLSWHCLAYAPHLLPSAASAPRAIAGEGVAGGACHARDDARAASGVDGARDDLAFDVAASIASDYSFSSTTSSTSSSSRGGRRVDHRVVDDDRGLVFAVCDAQCAIGGRRRLDYVITQLDVSRMARRVDPAAPRDLVPRDDDDDGACARASSVPPPSGAHHPADASLLLSAETSSLILSSHEDDDDDDDGGRVSDVVSRPPDAPVVEVCFERCAVLRDDADHPPERHGRGMEDDPCHFSFSWMMVPSDAGEDGMTRMSASDAIGDVPVSISICKSNTNDDAKSESQYYADAAIEHRATCERPFRDGDGALCALSSRNLPHRGCVDASRVDGVSGNQYYSMCEEDRRRTPSRMEDFDDCRVKASSSWGIKRWGSLMTGLGSHK
jgi:hypothetical protein